MQWFLIREALLSLILLGLVLLGLDLSQLCKVFLECLVVVAQ